jgi:hypothetical protein
MAWFHLAWTETYSRLTGAVTGQECQRCYVLQPFPNLFYSIYVSAKQIDISSTDQNLECVMQFKSPPGIFSTSLNAHFKAKLKGNGHKASYFRPF